MKEKITPGEVALFTDGLAAYRTWFPDIFGYAYYPPRQGTRGPHPQVCFRIPRPTTHVQVIIDEEGRQVVYVPVRPLVEHMGLSWSGQRERINRDAVLSEKVQGVRVTRTPEEGGYHAERLYP